MNGEVKSAQEATAIALSVIEKQYGFTRPIKAVKEGNIWLVQIDVGVFKTRIGNFKIDAKTGVVLEYDIPKEDKF